MAQAIMVIEIFVPKGDPDTALSDQIGHRVLDQIRVAMVSKAPGESLDDATTPDDLPKKKPTRVRGDVATIESGDDLTAPICLKSVPRRITVCHGRLISFSCW